MAYIRKPIYNFKDTGSTGIHEAANDRLLFVESQRKLFVKLNNTGLTDTSTIQDAITAGNIDEFTTGGAGTDVVYISANHSAIANQLVVCDTAGAALAEDETNFTVTLPAAPNNNDLIQLMDGSGNAQDRPIKVGRNGNSINGIADDITLDVNFFDIKLVFENGNWSLGGN